MPPVLTVIFFERGIIQLCKWEQYGSSDIIRKGKKLARDKWNKSYLVTRFFDSNNNKRTIGFMMVEE